MQAYDTILCDLGNVLVDFDHRISVRKVLFYTPKKQEEIYNLFFDSALTRLFEEGRLTPEGFFKRVKNVLELKIDYEAFISIWNEIFFQTALNIKMYNLLKDVKSRYKLVLISNINKTHFEFIREKMDIFNIFDRLILSYEAGFRKPAIEIYKIAMESVHTSPDKVFYIDDRRDLIDEAKRFGVEGIVFDGRLAFENLERILAN